MNADALMAEVLANPDDDAPRLVYADWLEEHGDLDRATFIRAQIRQAQLDPATDEHKTLAEQARQLLHKHWAAWRADLPRALARVVEFRRGFVAEINWTATQVAKVSKRVWARHPIQELILNEVSGRLDPILALPSLNRVRKLFLHAGCLTDGDLASLSACANLTGLRELAIRGHSGNGLAAALARCPSLTGLTHLRLDDRNLADEGVATLAGSGNFRRLNQLSLDAPSLGAAGARALAGSPHLSALTELLVSDSRFGDEGLAALANSPHLVGLRWLWLFRQRIGPDGVRALAATQHLSALQSLYLGSNPIGPEGARALAFARLPELTKLKLGSCDLLDEGALALAGSRCLEQLTELDLVENGIGTVGAVALARSSGLSGLLRLNLRGNPIGDEGARALCESQTLDKLQLLGVCLPRREEFSPEIVAALRQRFGKALYL
jgi:uncharacterized protein (TIGR02996 family)